MSTARIIKKYPNRRLYDTEDSRYITLADIRQLILKKTDLVVIDKKSGDDITRSILLQVISDQEMNGDAIMSQDFLIRIIRCYGKVLSDALSRQLEQSLRQFMAQPQNFRNSDAMPAFLGDSKNTLTPGP